VDRITHAPSGKWEFDDSVTDIFEDMLRRSIPQYNVMRQSVLDICVKYAKAGKNIIDLGCSRGDVVSELITLLGTDYCYVGCDISEPMLAVCRERFKAYGNDVVRIEKIDLRTDYPQTPPACVVLSVLTLQFTPIEYRQRIIKQIYESLLPGGAFLLVEKVLGDTSDLNDLMVDKYYSLKSVNGYSDYEIERKRLSLEGVLVPVTARWNRGLLKNAGFKQIDCFWRWMNFGGWIAVK
jgi:tRNA (cmo5U34)-methyltransferase